jgi:hypothetical protein
LSHGVDDVVKVSLELDERLRKYVHGIARNTELPPDVQELFVQIAEEERQEEAELAVISDQLKRI